MVEESTTMTSVAATPPNVRMAPLAKFAPVTTTDVPPSVVPLAGVSPITLSAVGEGPVDPHPDAASTDNSTVAAVCVRPIQLIIRQRLYLCSPCRGTVEERVP